MITQTQLITQLPKTGALERQSERFSYQNLICFSRFQNLAVGNWLNEFLK